MNSESKITNIGLSYQLFEKTRICNSEKSLGTNFEIFYLIVFNAPDNMKLHLSLENQVFSVRKQCSYLSRNFN